MGGDSAAGILPAHRIAALAEAGGDRRGDALRRRPDPAGEPRSPPRRRSPIASARASCPGPNATVAEQARPRSPCTRSTSADGAVLETGCVYIVPLLESLALPPDIAARRPTRRSSTGRLDIFTRVITDRAREFDTIPAGYHGPLYLEISPRTFPIVVRAGSRLSQIRFRTRQRAASTMPSSPRSMRETPLVDGDAAPRRRPRAVDRPRRRRATASSAIAPSATPASSTSTSAAPSTSLDFWEPIATHGKRELVLDPDEFYILVSREAVHVPPDYAAEMVPFDPLVGEFRVHYAGFFDPGFGHSRGRRRRQPRRARSPQPRGALHPRARPDRRPPRLRAHARAAATSSTAATSAPTTRRRA